MDWVEAVLFVVHSQQKIAGSMEHTVLKTKLQPTFQLVCRTVNIYKMPDILTKLTLEMPSCASGLDTQECSMSCSSLLQ